MTRNGTKVCCSSETGHQDRISPSSPGDQLLHSQVRCSSGPQRWRGQASAHPNAKCLATVTASPSLPPREGQGIVTSIGSFLSLRSSGNGPNFAGECPLTENGQSFPEERTPHSFYSFEWKMVPCACPAEGAKGWGAQCGWILYLRCWWPPPPSDLLMFARRRN